jgi:hypothetical protein
MVLLLWGLVAGNWSLEKQPWLLLLLLLLCLPLVLVESWLRLLLVSLLEIQWPPSRPPYSQLLLLMLHLPLLLLLLPLPLLFLLLLCLLLLRWVTGSQLLLLSVPRASCC